MGRGKGWHGDSAGHRAAGRRGGMATRDSHPDNYYMQIGAKGGALSSGNFKHNPKRASIAGKKGGKR